MTGFDQTTLPYCSFVRAGESRRRVGVGVGSGVLDLTSHAQQIVPRHAALFALGSLNPLLSAGPDVWAQVRHALLDGVADQPLLSLDDVQLVMPFAVADYVDFYASEHHATNLGRILRPGAEALLPNWKHLPVGYHGRSGTVVVSGTPVRRPSGQVRAGDAVAFGPTERLDVEAEIGFVVGAGSALGEPVGVGDFEQHVFGVCVVNDWSARDIQAWEYVPLGPFLGKSFATSISPWIVPLAALEGARIDPPPRDVELLPYLHDADPWGLDLELVVVLNGQEISRPQFASTYWTGAQMLAHLTVNGASLRTGDLFASGTVSGPAKDQRGSLIELSWNGADPLELADGTTRTFLQDGDVVTISARARLADGGSIWLGQVDGTVTA